MFSSEHKELFFFPFNIYQRERQIHLALFSNVGWIEMLTLKAVFHIKHGTWVWIDKTRLQQWSLWCLQVKGPCKPLQQSKFKAPWSVSYLLAELVSCICEWGHACHHASSKSYHNLKSLHWKIIWFHILFSLKFSTRGKPFGKFLNACLVFHLAVSKLLFTCSYFLESSGKEIEAM